VASFTSCEIVAAKRAFAIVTRHAALAPARRVMIKRFGCCYLAALRLARTDVVTFVTRHFLMLGVAEPDAKRRHHHGRARITAELVTSST
jgi:hypothetical protein